MVNKSNIPYLRCQTVVGHFEIIGKCAVCCMVVVGIQFIMLGVFSSEWFVYDWILGTTHIQCADKYLCIIANMKLASYRDFNYVYI